LPLILWLKWDFSKILSHAAEVETIYGKSN